MNAIKRSLADWILRVAAKRALQPAFEKLHILSLLGMNAGGATLSPKYNGELRVLQRVRDALAGSKDIVVVDVGANQGVFARNVRSILEPTCRLYCFEPGAAAFDLLQGGLAGAPRVQLFNSAVGDKEEEALLYSDSEASVCASLHREAFILADQAVTRVETVRVLRLDGFCRAAGLDRIDLLKVDAEGHELAVLRGAGELLSGGRVRFIQFEFGRHHVASRTFLRDFFELLGPDYRIFRVLGDGLRELAEYDSRYEVFYSAADFLAIHRSVEPQS